MSLPATPGDRPGGPAAYVQLLRQAVEAMNDLMATVVNGSEWSQEEYDRWDDLRTKIEWELSRV